MVVLENIKKIGNIIEADYYYDYTPEGSRGHFKYNITTGKYVELKRIKEFEYGFAHIKYALESMIKHNKYPERHAQIWF